MKPTTGNKKTTFGKRKPGKAVKNPNKHQKTKRTR
jgi:hypothetical protein